MRFDDRLDTVLRQPVRGAEIARVQYVQLLDLLGKTAAGAESPMLDAAYARLSALSSEIAGTERARLLRDSGLKLRNPALVAFLADADPPLASAAIAAADLDEQEWLDLVPALPIRARGVLRHRRDLGPLVEARLERLGVIDRGLPAAEPREAAPAVPQPAPPAEAPPRESPIGELVRRIEQYRKERPAPLPAAANEAPRLPLGDNDLLPPRRFHRFDFVTDASGHIVRADAEAAPMLVGTPLGALAFRRVAGSAPAPAEALRLRQPIEGQVVTFDGAPAIAGEWRIDAAPLFDAATGRYTGHAGRARRLVEADTGQAREMAVADRMRQVLHELRNPAGAIQMASEFIQQQVGGPVPHEYRALAATIASDTASVLGGLDEVERLVKFDAGVAGVEPGETDLAALVAATIALLDPTLTQRESGFLFDPPGEALPVSMARADLERLVWRLLAALANAAGPAERIALRLSAQAEATRLEIALPAALGTLSDEALFAAHASTRGPALSAGMFGLGFTLRLAAAEARSAGGSLRREGAALALDLPASPREEAASEQLG